MCRKQALAEVQALAAVGEINDNPNMFPVWEQFPFGIGSLGLSIKSLKEGKFWSLEFGPSLRDFLQRAC